VGSEEIPSCPDQSPPFRGSNGRFGGCEILICSGSDFHKYDAAVRIDHNKVDLARFAGEVGGEFSQALAFEVFLACPLTPATKSLRVRKQFASAKENHTQGNAKIKYQNAKSRKSSPLGGDSTILIFELLLLHFYFEAVCSLCLWASLTDLPVRLRR
jgi:hypothetical protein